MYSFVKALFVAIACIYMLSFVVGISLFLARRNRPPINGRMPWISALCSLLVSTWAFYTISLVFFAGTQTHTHPFLKVLVSFPDRCC